MWSMGIPNATWAAARSKRAWSVNALEHGRPVSGDCGGCQQVLELLCHCPGPQARSSGLNEVARFGLRSLEGIHDHAAVADNLSGYLGYLGLKRPYGAHHGVPSY